MLGTGDDKARGNGMQRVFVACRPLRADECLPVLTHRSVTSDVAKIADTGDTPSLRHHKKHDKVGSCSLSVSAYICVEV